MQSAVLFLYTAIDDPDLLRARICVFDELKVSFKTFRQRVISPPLQNLLEGLPYLFRGEKQPCLE